MIFTAKSVFGRKGAEDKEGPVVETRAASTNNHDAGIASADANNHDQFHVSGVSRRRSWFEYIKTREFWMALVLG